MASTVYKTIVIQWPVRTGPRLKEALCAAAIGPGELLEFDANDALILNAQAAGVEPVNKLVAVESPIASDLTAAAIDQDYASGDTVRYVVPLPGAVLNMFLADGETVVKGDGLVSDGAGALELVALGTALMPDSIFGYAFEDKAASGSAARILVEVA